MDSHTAWTQGPTLSVWTYDSPRGAAAGKVRLDRLSQRGAVVVVDAVTVIWIRGAHRPRIGRPHVGSIPVATRRSTLEILLGRLMFGYRDTADVVPALACDLAGTGLTEEFLRELRAGFVPDSSALLVLSLAADPEEVQAVIERGRARGDVRLRHLDMTQEGLEVLEAFAHASALQHSW